VVGRERWAKRGHVPYSTYYDKYSEYMCSISRVCIMTAVGARSGVTRDAGAIRVRSRTAETTDYNEIRHEVYALCIVSVSCAAINAEHCVLWLSSAITAAVSPSLFFT